MVIILIIGYAVLLWIIGLVLGQEPWGFALKGTGITIALGFLLAFLYVIKILILG